jgi:AAA+ ATPase superfamily predicted ATPase
VNHGTSHFFLLYRGIFTTSLRFSEIFQSEKSVFSIAIVCYCEKLSMDKTDFAGRTDSESRTTWSTLERPHFIYLDVFPVLHFVFSDSIRFIAFFVDFSI